MTDMKMTEPKTTAQRDIAGQKYSVHKD